MKLTVDHTELVTLLENNLNINNAILTVAQKARKIQEDGISGRNMLNMLDDTTAVLDSVVRSHELILQSIKSNTAIINQIRERHE